MYSSLQQIDTDPDFLLAQSGIIGLWLIIKTHNSLIYLRKDKYFSFNFFKMIYLHSLVRMITVNDQEDSAAL